MTDEGPISAPRRLVDAAGMDLVFVEVEREFRRGLDESEAWERLQTELTRAHHRTANRNRLRWLIPLAAALLPLGLFFADRMRNPPAQLQATQLPEVAESAVAVDLVAPSPQPIEAPRAVASVTKRLAEGENRLPDSSVVTLHPKSQADFSDNPGHSVVTLNSGEADVSVTHKKLGHHFSVLGGAYEFRVVGTKFAVKHVASHTELHVSEGRVAVLEGVLPIASVGAGEFWSSEEPSVIAREPKPISAKPNKPTEPKSDELSNCRDKLRAGDSEKAESCYRDLATGQGLSAEMALYESARLERDVLGNLRVALATLEEHQQRFPTGVLSPEIRLSKIDLLARLGQSEDALKESDQLLLTPVGRARQSELRLLRGKILRDKLGDCARAEREYAVIEHDASARGDTAEFARAGCLERLGRRAEAAAVYKSYLARSKPHYADTARARLQEIEP